MDIVFFLSKAFWFVARPGNLILLAILAGTLAAWIWPARSGRWWLSALSAALLLVTFAPVAAWVTQPLEQRFAIPAALPERVDGILVLGGFLNADVSARTGLITVHESAERIMVSAALARRHPEARLVVTGRGVDQPALSSWLKDLGIDPARVVFEPDARITHENASLSLELVGPEAGDVWLLVTSAQHMPRAVGVFRKIGWDVIPYPVDHQVSSVAPWAAWPDVALNLTRIDGGIKEWVGLLVYYLLDRTSEFFPGPDTPHQTNQA